MQDLACVTGKGMSVSVRGAELYHIRKGEMMETLLLAKFRCFRSRELMQQIVAYEKEGSSRGKKPLKALHNKLVSI